jgi:UDP-N-acetylglucosamine 2-epimerase (non-hydrolysing)
MMPLKILAVVGARPNFMKVAPLIWEAQRRPGIAVRLVHTGQHYDEKMSHLFFEELRLPRPDVNLEVGSGSHAVQTAEVMKRFEPVLLEERPDLLVVVGDVNSTLACALVATKLLVPVAHVEAGLRSGDRTMPEEINRILTDAISDWLFVTEASGVENLRREGIPDERVFLVGNVMMDTLVACKPRIDASPILERVGVERGEYAVLTLHRPANVDDPETLGRLMGAIERLQREVPFVFPVHPRTRRTMSAYQEGGKLPNLRFTEPLGYLDFMKLLSHARLVLTDSGGVQEETTFLGVPCLTMRENTERPITVTEGTNRLVGLDPKRIVAAGLNALAGAGCGGRVPRLWDGHAAGRILDVLCKGARSASEGMGETGLAGASGSPVGGARSASEGLCDPTLAGASGSQAGKGPVA